jgi:hypothetical protein
LRDPLRKAAELTGVSLKKGNSYQFFLEVEPLTGRRHVAITEHRTRKDWGLFVKGMLEERYPQATKVRLVMDNLNTHTAASLYETFEPEEARRLARRLEIHYTPKHQIRSYSVRLYLDCG